MAPSLRLNSGTTRSINGNSGIGGVSSSSGGVSSSRLFQNRGALTKLSTSSSTSLSAGGGSRSSVPRPVNTSSLRKENGGQDISAVLVNRHGGKKLGWGSSLPDKTPAPTASNTSTTTTSNNTNTTDVVSTTRMHHRQGIGLGRTRSIAPLDPTPEEALAAAEALKKKELPGNSTGTTQQQDAKDTNPTTPAAPASQNTPWALHAPTPQPRDPITGMPPADVPHDNRGPGGTYGHARPSDSQYSRYHNGQNQQYNNHHSSPSHYHHNQDYPEDGGGGGGGSYNYRYGDNYQNQYQNNHRGVRGRYSDRDTSTGPYDRHSQHQHHSNHYDNNRDNRYDYQSNYNQRRYDNRGGDDGGGGSGGYYQDRRERYHHQYPPTAAGLGGAVDHSNSHRDRHSYRNEVDGRSTGTSGQHYNSHQYRRARGGEEGYEHQTPIQPEVNDSKEAGDTSVPIVQSGSNISRTQRETARRVDTGGDYERDVGTSSAGGYDPRYDRRSISSNRDYNRHNPNYHRYQRDSGRGGGYERKHDYGHHQGLTSPVVEEEHEDDDEDEGNDEKDHQESPSEVGDGEKVNGGKEREKEKKQDGAHKEDNEQELSKESHNEVSVEESEDDAPRQILRHDSQPITDGGTNDEAESFVNHSDEAGSNLSLERLVAVEEDKQLSHQTSQTQNESSCTELGLLSPDKSRDDGLSLDTETFDENENSDDDDLSDGSLDPAHEIVLPAGAREEKHKNVAPSTGVEDEDENPVIDREFVIKQQQQNILRKVEAAREERKRSAGMAVEDSSKALQQHMVNSEVSNAPSSPSIDSKEDRTAPAINIQLSEEDRTAREALRKEYLVKWAAERAARIEHRRIRNPRTRGVLFRRMEDGSLMNADLSEREITKRLERKLKKEARNRKMSSSSSLPLGKAAAPALTSESLSSSKHRGRQGKSKSKVESNDPPPLIVDDEISVTPSTSVEPVKETKPFVPSPGPAVSAWVAGPPPGMVKKQPEQQQPVESHSIISPSPLEKKNNHRHNHKRNPSNNASRTVEDVASKLDRVLSSNLLDIANSASWSSKPNASGNTITKQHTKVAVGPIMSDWTAFAGGQVDYPYESFGDSSAKPPENSTAVQVDGESGKRGGTSTLPPPPTATVSDAGTDGAGTDWSMDFALPHDLLSSVADSEDRDTAINTTAAATSESVEIKNGGRKSFNSSKGSSRYKGRRKPLHNQQRSNNSGSSSTKKKNFPPKSNDVIAKKGKSSSRRPGSKSKKDVTGATKKKSNRSGGSRSNGSGVQPRPPN